MTNTEMIYNKITLAFQENQEVIFLKTYFFDSIVQFRVSFVLVIILYGVFGYLDKRMFPEYANLFHFIRYLFVIPLLTSVFLLSFTKLFRKVWQVLLLISFIAAGSGISFMTMLVPENYAYYAGMMLIFSAGYFFIKLRFFLATIAGWTTLIVFNLGAIFYAHVSQIILINNNFFFISANIIGMFAAYNNEYYARRNFFLNQKLDNEKLFVENLNKNLEKIIDKRTEELVKAKDKAEESDRLKSAFLANMSHEIRTPMNGILGFAELLKEPNLSGDEQKEYIRIIEKSGARMLNTINEIVDISKIEAGLIEVNINELNINELMDFTFQFFKPEVESKGMILLRGDILQNQDAIIKTDKDKLNAILFNLIKNAVKYTKTGIIEFGYSIQLRSSSDDIPEQEELLFYVKDTGIGIPLNRQTAIFERFIQADILDKQAYQGAGLGLSISKAYVEILGGRIWVKSLENKGSTFYFTIPYSNYKPKNDNISQVTKDREKQDQINPENLYLKILIAEDDEISEKLISLAVGTISTNILKARTGIQAVDICRLHPDIDLVLMDIRMPEMDGYEAIRQIRQFNKEVVIIVQTAHGLIGDREKALEAGCNDYISKPIKINELKLLIQKYIKN